MKMLMEHGRVLCGARFVPDCLACYREIRYNDNATL